MAAQYVPRLCVGESCGVDISHTRYNCIRCAACQLTYRNVLRRTPSVPVARVCKCGCRQSIEHMHKTAKYLPECKTGADKMRRCTSEYRERDRLYRKTKSKPYIPSATGAPARPGPKIQSEPEYIPTVHCKVCYGLPWARTPDRMVSEFENSDTVANDTGRCKGCNEPYAPEPRPDAGSLIRSSAGTMKDAGNLYGYSAHHSYGDKSLDGRDRSGIRREKKGK